MRFPSEVDPGYAGWHFDSGMPRGDKTWASVHSPTRALLSLFLFTDVGEDDSPTLLLRGSHVDVASLLGGAGDEGLEWCSLESLLPPAAFERETVPATGVAGDVYLCHPFLVHRASWPHRGQTARIIAQPSVWLKEPYALVDPLAAFPVEQAILRAPRPPVDHKDGGMSDYVAVNRANWDSRVPHHVAAYGLELFRDDPEHLSAWCGSTRRGCAVSGGSTWCTFSAT